MVLELSGLAAAFLPWQGFSSSTPVITPPVTHGKAQPGTPGAAFLPVIKSDGVSINVFSMIFLKIQLSDTLVNLRNYFPQGLFFPPAVILNILNESALIYDDS